MPPEQREQEAARLYDSFGAPLFRYALMILGERGAAEDVIQQVFLSVLDRRTRHIDDPRTYLRAAVRNACYSLLRSRRLRGSPAGGPGEELLEAIPEAAQPVPLEDRLALDAGIRALPPEQREVVHLHVFEGLTFKEVAAATGEPANTVASRYRYALEKLRAHFLGTP